MTVEALPLAAQLRAAMAATWPPEAVLEVGPFLLRRAPGAGQRVTAATAAPGAADLAESLPRAEAQMLSWGQHPLFQVVPETPGLDALLDAAGYAIKDPTILYVAPAATLAQVPTPRLSTFAHWPPLAVQDEIWEEGGIGPERRAVMHRAPIPHMSLMAREADRPVGTGFAALHEGIVAVHAVEVRPDHRRRGVGGRLMSRAAQWAQEVGAAHVALAVTEANVAARALYTALGMTAAARYHYRIAP